MVVGSTAAFTASPDVTSKLAVTMSAPSARKVAAAVADLTLQLVLLVLLPMVIIQVVEQVALVMDLVAMLVFITLQASVGLASASQRRS